MDNMNQPMLSNEIRRINPSDNTIYDIMASGWAGRFWPKGGCDASGNNCVYGQSSAPCPIGGCQPPSDTKCEFYFPPINSPTGIYYDTSLVSE